MSVPVLATAPRLRFGRSGKPADGLQEFQRYEFKYLLNARLLEAIEGEVRHFMRYDGHVHPELGNAYFVRSLYFDDPFSSAFYEKIDGIMERRKFRLRTYGQVWEPNLPIFLETKGRTNERTYKHRIAVQYEHLGLFTAPSEIWTLLDIYERNVLVEKFVFDTCRKNLSARVLVDYLRRPYVSDYDSNFRLTFDRTVKSSATDSLFPEPNSANWIECVPGWTILEVKFDRRLPKWFHRILQNYEMRRLSISKFCLGMKDCGVAEDLS
jgi:hypothetical protein